MDDGSGESAVEDEVAGVGMSQTKSGWSELGCRREGGSWFQRRGEAEAYWKKRSVIRKEDGRGWSSESDQSWRTGAGFSFWFCVVY